jgi:hypothetical protein
MKLRLVAAAVVVAASLASASMASASSIVYIKGGNVFLSSPDGSVGYQVTSGGGWSSPSQADDGTIVAVQNEQVFRMTPSGRLLNAPIDTVYSGGAGSPFHGPFGVRVSPDASNVAFWGGYDETGSWDGYNWWQLDVSSMWGPADQFGTPNQVLGQQDYTMPSWIDRGRLLLSNINAAMIAQVAVYAIGGGDNSEVQWFSDPAAPWLEDGVASRDQSRLAFASAGDVSAGPQQIRIYSTQGIPSGNPGDPLPPAPQFVCGVGAGEVSDPSFSPDGSAVVWQAADGVHAAGSDCSGDHLVIPGGSEPFWGPADVNMANNPATTPASSGSSGSSGGSGSGGASTGSAPGRPSAGSAGSTPTAGSTTPAPAVVACTVPNLKRLTLARARAALHHAGCRLGRVHRPRSIPAHHLLRVSLQSPRARTRHRSGYPVSITLR